VITEDDEGNEVAENGGTPAVPVIHPRTNTLRTPLARILAGPGGWVEIRLFKAIKAVNGSVVLIEHKECLPFSWFNLFKSRVGIHDRDPGVARLKR